MADASGDGELDGFRRSSYCNHGGCVEVDRTRPDVVRVRHSVVPGAVLALSRAEWAAFVAGVKAGEFDLLPEQYA